MFLNPSLVSQNNTNDMFLWMLFDVHVERLQCFPAQRLILGGFTDTEALKGCWLVTQAYNLQNKKFISGFYQVSCLNRVERMKKLKY